MKRSQKFERRITYKDIINNCCGFFYTPTNSMTRRLGLVLVENKNSTGIKYVSDINIQGLNRISDSMMEYYAVSLFYEPNGTLLSDYLWTAAYNYQSTQDELSYAYEHQFAYYKETVPQKYFIATKVFVPRAAFFEECKLEVKDKIKLYPGDKIRLVFHNYKMIGRINYSDYTYSVSNGQYDIDFSGTVTFKITE